MYKGHIALHELEAVALMLHRLAFQLPDKWFPYNWIKVPLKLTYVIKVVQYLFLSRLASHIRNLADKHGILLFQLSYLPTSMWKPTIYHRESWSLSGIFWHCWSSFPTWGHLEMDLLSSSCTNQYQLYYTLEKPLFPWAMGLNAFNHPWEF